MGNYRVSSFQLTRSARFLLALHTLKYDVCATRGFYNPAGWGPLGVVAGFPLGAWAGIVSIMMLRKRETLVSMPVRFG